MIELGVQPQGERGAAGPEVHARPAADNLIKEEPRTLVWRQPLPDGQPAVWKLYRHCKVGLPQRCGCYRCRGQREYEALRHLERQGLPCSRAAFWACGTEARVGAYSLLVTHEVPQACNFQNWLDASQSNYSPLLQPLFQLVAAMHRSGLQHGAMLERNILHTPAGFHLIDLPQARLFRRSIEGRHAGWFDLTLLVHSLTRHLDDEVLISGLAGYPRLPRPARAFVQRVRAEPWSRRYRKFLGMWYTAQAFGHRLLGPIR